MVFGRRIKILVRACFSLFLFLSFEWAILSYLAYIQSANNQWVPTSRDVMCRVEHAPRSHRVEALVEDDIPVGYLTIRPLGHGFSSRAILMLPSRPAYCVALSTFVRCTYTVHIMLDYGCPSLICERSILGRCIFFLY